MTTLEKQTLKNSFDQHDLSAPSNKDEDWLYYDLDHILNLEVSKTDNKKPLKEYSGHYLYFKNGELVNHVLPDEVSITETSIIPNKTSNNFIHFATKNSKNIELSIENCTSNLQIIYDNDTGLHSSAVSIKANDSTLTLNRIFLCEKESSITNNYIQIKAINSSNIVMNEQNMNNRGKVLDFVDTSLTDDCHLIGLNQSYLSDDSRFQNRVFINGENATARLNGLGINDENKQCFYNTHIYHNIGDTESHQLFKSINKNNALFEYNGKVSVKKDAQQINSYQLNQNILLDEYATIHSRPQLFIDADDVKCSHGSTTGDLNQEELFYLMSRGLDKVASQKIILRAFIDECFDHPLLKQFKIDLNQFLNCII